MSELDGAEPNARSASDPAKAGVEPELEGIDAEPTAAEKAVVEEGRASIKEFVSNLKVADIKSGDWFARLLTVSLATYTKKVDWQYFQEKYQGVPADAVVDQRIKMAARYAAIEGGLSASAYTGVIIATLGSAGGASPVTVPAAVGTLMVDLAYITQLQLRLAYDIAVLYRVPLDLDDPDDLWKLIRVAFMIKSGELVTEGALKAVPAIMRPLIKRFFSGTVLTTAKSLPVVGKFLLQRNLIKVGIPLVGIPLAVFLNRWTTAIAGKHARKVFRNEARVIEVAERLVERSDHHELLLWAAWAVVKADEKISDDEALLMRHLTRILRERHSVSDERLAQVIDVDHEELWSRISDAEGDLGDVLAAAEAVAAVDGEANAKERALLDEIRRRSFRE